MMHLDGTLWKALSSDFRHLNQPKAIKPFIDPLLLAALPSYSSLCNCQQTVLTGSESPEEELPVCLHPPTEHHSREMWAFNPSLKHV